jgi:hypothetical protein
VHRQFSVQVTQQTARLDAHSLVLDVHSYAFHLMAVENR